MAWKWYDVTQYKASVGGGPYYGGAQLLGPNFYAALTFHKSGTLPAATAPVVAGTQRFYGHLDYQQIEAFVDILRNEKPLRFGWDDANPSLFHLMSSEEPIGEGDGQVHAEATLAARQTP
jgi:hypothetical protein